MHITLPSFMNSRVLVVGDVMLDRYWIGAASRISPEAPVPVIQVKQVKDSAGGAGNVALNIAALQGQATLLGVIGNDEMGQILENLLKKAEVAPLFVVDPKSPTITKSRVLSQHQQLIRLDFEEVLASFDQENLQALYQTQLAHHDVIVLSDYHKGTLSKVAVLIERARLLHKKILIDPKGNDFTRYRNATLLTPNFKEFEAIVGPCANEKEIEEKGLALITELNLEALLITRSEKGMTLLQKHKPALHIPTQARDVFDVTGAGDTVIGVLAASLAAGQSLEEAVILSNVAAGLVVAKSGSATVTVAELEQAIAVKPLATKASVMDLNTLLGICHELKKKQHKIVMTNGCFDLLHAGHIAYLEEAKALGDCLIVAVNDDLSVKRLKGETRPIVPLEHRMAVLAGLKAVDYVIAFSEDTPASLIEKILPDVLVKGADYTVEQVAGAEAVLANGGEVKMLKFKDGCSTSRIIEKIKQA